MPKMIAAALVILLPRAVAACPVCFGQSDSPMASAANMSILAMLAVTGAVLAAFACFMVRIARRAKLASERESGTREPGGSEAPARC